MRYFRLFVLIVISSVFIFACNNNNNNNFDFENAFSIPREPITALAPGQFFTLNVPEGKKVVITDIYIDNIGGGTSALQILEKKGPNTFSNRYTFRTDSNKKTIINFTTGLRLGDEFPIQGSIRILNDDSSQANILPRVNGFITQ